MRTTITLDDELYAEAKRLAGQTGRTVSDFIEEALRELLTRKQILGERLPIKLKTVSGQGLLPGVDLDDLASLLESIDTADGSNRI